MSYQRMNKAMINCERNMSLTLVEITLHEPVAAMQPVPLTYYTPVSKDAIH
jgi:hypothetical protein